MSRKSPKINVLVFAGLLVLGAPLFFDVYRITAFNAVPHDDYVPYLLYVLGKDGGEVPGSPTGYRLFSVWIAVPFYYVLPLFKFSYLEGKSEVYLKALQGLSFVTYLAASFTSFLIYRITKMRFGGSEMVSLSAALVALLLLRFTAVYSIDPTAIMFICLILFHLENRWIFAGLLAISVGINEKIAFLFVLLFGARQFFKKGGISFHFAASIFACALYFLVRSAVDLPGHEYMVQPWRFAEKAGHTLGLLFTAKSLYLNWLPGLMTLGLFCLAAKEHRLRQKTAGLMFSKSDVFPLAGFFIIALITDMQFTVGRILLFCFPLYLPLAILYLERYFNQLKNEN